MTGTCTAAFVVEDVAADDEPTPAAAVADGTTTTTETETTRTTPPVVAAATPPAPAVEPAADADVPTADGADSRPVTLFGFSLVPPSNHKLKVGASTGQPPLRLAGTPLKGAPSRDACRTTSASTCPRRRTATTGVTSRSWWTGSGRRRARSRRCRFTTIQRAFSRNWRLHVQLPRYATGTAAVQCSGWLGTGQRKKLCGWEAWAWHRTAEEAMREGGRAPSPHLSRLHTMLPPHPDNPPRVGRGKDWTWPKRSGWCMRRRTAAMPT